jgi:hypothetical protein
MSERFATNVEIGGDIPRSLIASLAEAIQSAGLGLEWGDTSSTKDLRKALLGCDGKSTLHVKSNQQDQKGQATRSIFAQGGSL